MLCRSRVEAVAPNTKFASMQLCLCPALLPFQPVKRITTCSTYRVTQRICCQVPHARDGRISQSFPALLISAATAFSILAASPLTAEASVSPGFLGVESPALPSFPDADFLQKIQEKNRKKYEDFDANIKASPFVQGLLTKSRENADKNRREIEEKYCLRGAEWGVGDCSLNGLSKGDRDAVLEALRKGNYK